MASGDSLLLFTPQSIAGPGSLNAQIDALLGTSSPAESVLVLAFDSVTIEYADFQGVMPANYAGGGLTVRIFSGAGTTTGTVIWNAAFRRIEDDLEDLDTTVHTYDYNAVTLATLPTAVGELSRDNITFTNGADMDSVAAGDAFILRVRRDTADTAAADAFIHRIEIKET